jgi:hypothetical protein
MIESLSVCLMPEIFGFLSDIMDAIGANIQGKVLP